jgi:hypothetical protein
MMDSANSCMDVSYEVFCELVKDCDYFPNSPGGIKLI